MPCKINKPCPPQNNARPPITRTGCTPLLLCQALQGLRTSCCCSSCQPSPARHGAPQVVGREEAGAGHGLQLARRLALLLGALWDLLHSAAHTAGAMRTGPPEL